MEPQSLEVFIDYCSALLWLMGELGQARTSEAIAEFDRRLGDLVLPQHRELTSTGKLKWAHDVAWSRQALVNAGLMGSGGRGVWTITEAGRDWLRDHPDGGKRELAALIRGSQTRRKERSEPAQEPGQRSIRLAGEAFILSRAEVLAEIRSALTRGLPPEATRFEKWYLPVDGQRVSIKWVVSVVTGLSTSVFTTYQAMHQLRKLGLEAGQVDKPQAMGRPAGEAALATPELTREAFYRTVLAQLEGKLPPGVHNRGVNPRTEYLRLNHPAPRTHYEIHLHKSYTFLGLVFYGPETENRARLAPFEQAVPELEAQMGRPVHTGVGGKSYSAVYLRLPPAKLDLPTARELATAWLSLVRATVPLLDRVLGGLGQRVPRPRPKDEDLERPKVILAEEIRRIRGCLVGSLSPPGDEKLCDLIQFCYIFELFDEGVALFRLVRPDAVHSWLYERTRKLARVCELRAKR